VSKVEGTASAEEQSEVSNTGKPEGESRKGDSVDRRDSDGSLWRMGSDRFWGGVKEEEREGEISGGVEELGRVTDSRSSEAVEEEGSTELP
jgi:hypothetical protein